jgi:uncharacterized protein (TIGR02391 family)
LVTPVVLLQEQIERAEALKLLSSFGPHYRIWCDTTAEILQSNFTNRYEKSFNEIIHPTMYVIAQSSEELRTQLEHRLDESIQLLQAIIAESHRFQNNATIDISRTLPLVAYDWHREIKEVSLTFYEHKHYAQAVEEAFKRVIQEVKEIYKRKTGQDADGESLMNRAFGCTGQIPIIAFNQLANREDRDEQTGMMNLFKGIVGIRNKKAHTNVILDDPIRAIEYLSLASLLMRLLDQLAH